MIYRYKFIKIDLPVPRLFKKSDCAICWTNHYPEKPTVLSTRYRFTRWIELSTI